MLVHHLPLIEAIIAVLMGKSGGGQAYVPPPPGVADLNPFEEHGVSEAERKAGSKRKGSASSLVIPKPKKGVGPYAG